MRELSRSPRHSESFTISITSHARRSRYLDLVAVPLPCGRCGLCAATGRDCGRDGRTDVKSKTLLDETSPKHGAVYQKSTGLEMIRRDGYSPDNGLTWEKLEADKKFDADLPYGYRRAPRAPWRDPVNGNILLLVNSMDTPGKDPKAHEPHWQWYWYYIRYRVSTDGGRTYLFDEPIIQQGDEYSKEHPIDNIYISKNCFFIGDKGCVPIRTREGTILFPVQTPPLNPDGEGFIIPAADGIGSTA